MLPELGIKDMFDPILCNLSGISQFDKLLVSSAIHKAVIDINEKGTEAAAATTGVQWFAEQAIILPLSSLQSSFFLSETLPPHHFRNFGWKEFVYFALI